MRVFAMSRRAFLFSFLLCVLAVPCFGQDTYKQECDRLAQLLKWKRGITVAEIGAGSGKMTLLAARRIGPAGKVYATEIDPKAVAQLQQLSAGAPNIAAVQASGDSTNLPPGSCDSIYMRLVYHHLTRPVETDRSLFQALKPGGRLAVIDENPYPGTKVPDGVPPNRGGHGIPQQILIEELTAAGFKVEKIDNSWPARDAYHDIYGVICRKPKS